MDPTYTYLGYRLAQILSEVFGGERLISYTLHWTDSEQISHKTGNTCQTEPDPAHHSVLFPLSTPSDQAR